MKKNIYLFVAAVAAVFLSSCAGTYQYCQIYETKPVRQENLVKNDNGALRYENAQCAIDYNFWSNGGSADFYFYNKTDEIIYIDLAKSFYVRNGVAHDLFGAREWSQSSSVGVASSVSYGYSESASAALAVGAIVPSLVSGGAVGAKAAKAASRTVSATSGNAVAHTETITVTTKEKQIIAVPPHSKKYIRTHDIATTPYLSCDLQRYPSTSARIDFSADNSPYRFSDVITYTVGEDKQPVTVNGDFYVSSVTNYAEPEIVVMKKREELCENMRAPDYVKPERSLYDKVIRDSICETASSFYNTYDVKSEKRLYEDNKYKSYTYDYRYNAYVLSGSHGNPWIAIGIMGGIVGVAALLALFGL